jgi:hypothetical protein
LPDDGTTSDKAALSYSDRPVYAGSCRNVAVILDYGIMFHQRHRVDDAISPYSCPGIDDCAMHHD